jgi:hypothetical protein
MTLAYNSYELKEAGIIFTFFGSFWNNNGVSYTGYGFKNLGKDSTVQLLQRLEKEIDYISEIKNNDFNTYFSFSDMTFLLNKASNQELGTVSVKIFWRDFEAEWTRSSIERTQKRIEKWFKKKLN